MGAFDAYLRLVDEVEGMLVTDESLAKRTSFRVGGSADLAVHVASLRDLKLTLSVLREEQVPWTVLGRGSNTLVSDEGYRGAVITLGGEFCKQSVGTEGMLTFGAGMMLIRAVQLACAQGRGELTFAGGIPGSVGGAIRMNAGAHQGVISKHLDSVLIFSADGHVVQKKKADITWGYRFCDLSAGDIVLEATFDLPHVDPYLLRSELEFNLNQRKRKQPLGAKSCGSTFKNPTVEELRSAGVIGPYASRSVSAGKLIEMCGLKGYQVGGACVSPKHANFIINHKDTTAADIYQLIQIVMTKVKEEYGIELAPELTFLGFKDSPRAS